MLEDHDMLAVRSPSWASEAEPENVIDVPTLKTWPLDGDETVTVGAVFTQVLSESLRVAIQGSETMKEWFGSAALALDTAIYGLLLVLFIIYMPKGILGTLMEWWERRPDAPSTSRPTPKTDAKASPQAVKR